MVAGSEEELGELERKVIHMLVEIRTKREVGERWREIIYRLIEFGSKSKLEEGGRKVIDGEVEHRGFQREASERR